MRRTLRLLVLVATAVSVVACTDDGTASPEATPPTTTVAATTTLPASTTTTSTTSTTIVPQWQQFPIGPVTPYPVPSVGAPVVNRIETTDPVVFLTLDDGIVRDPRILPLLAQHGATATLFLNAGPMAQDPTYFFPFMWIGGTINSHTLNHPKLKGMSLEEQKYQICGDQDVIEYHYGSAGDLFRPPYGEYDNNTLRAAASCGIRAVVNWVDVLWEGHISTIGDKPIRPGDIFLGHFRVDLYDTLVYFFQRLDEQGLRVARLEDYLPAG